MIRRILAALGVLPLLLGGFSAVEADQLREGDVELQFRFSYNDLDFDGPGGSVDSEEVLVAVGYMLSDRHEIGAGVAYAGFGSSDSLEYGLSYQYNFGGGDSLNPYVAVFCLGFGGDRGDVFDFGYGGELGVKVYPWSHAGMVFGLAYRELQGAGGIPDATNVIASGGLSLKF